LSTESDTPFNIARVEFTSFHVHGSHQWVFVEITDDDGNTGLAELAGPGATTEIAGLTAQYAERLRLSPPVSESDVTAQLGLTVEELEADRTRATAVSALRTAIADAQARRSGVSLGEFLGGQRTESVQLYGNMNRSMLPDDDGPRDRSPEAFAAAAREAIRRGYEVVKCAPFDEARSPFEEPGLPEAARSGIDRIVAVREAIGPDVSLFVDCHNRFDLDSGIALEISLRESNVAWYEEAVDGIEQPDVMKRIRERATMDIAGAESGYGVGLFRRIIEGHVMDVVMPDIKFCGGAGEAVEIGRILEGIAPGSVSMHSPSGPASQLASAHVTAAFVGTRPLEHAWGEVDWRPSVLEPAERIESGRIYIPDGPGLGANLDQSTVEARGRHWTL
jgi:galactonate dehydratase